MDKTVPVMGNVHTTPFNEHLPLMFFLPFKFYYVCFWGAIQMAMIMRVRSMSGIHSPPDFLLPDVTLSMLSLFFLAAASYTAENNMYILFFFLSLE